MKLIGALIRDCGADGDDFSLARDAKLIKEAVTKLCSFKLDNTEFTCLKALCLFKPGQPEKITNNFSDVLTKTFYDTDISGLSQQAQIEMLQDQSHLMLQEYCQNNCKPGSVGGGITGLSKIRFGKLLLVLPRLSAICGKAIETLFFKKTVGNIPIEKIVSDLFHGS